MEEKPKPKSGDDEEFLFKFIKKNFVSVVIVLFVIFAIVGLIKTYLL